MSDELKDVAWIMGCMVVACLFIIAGGAITVVALRWAFAVPVGGC